MINYKKKEQKNSRNSLVFVLGSILWVSIIFLFSSKPNLHSPFSYNADFILRKIAHIMEYMILTGLAWKALLPRAKSNLLLVVFLLVFSAAVLDECHQLFVVGREGSLRDVLFDTGGIFLAWYFIGRKTKK
ncbi:MAG: VanZ family protein [Parcubacteria group bacterium]|jgi:VanZ family protein